MYQNGVKVYQIRWHPSGKVFKTNNGKFTWEKVEFAKRARTHMMKLNPKLTESALRIYEYELTNERQLDL